MGCAACTQVCSNQKDSFKNDSELLQVAKNKVMFLKKAFSKIEQKSLLQEFISQEQFNMMLHLMSLQEQLQPENILLPEAGQLSFLSQTRKTLWKLYSLDSLVYEYMKSPIIHHFTEDFSNVKISQKTKQRFYQISLDINRTYPFNKNLNKEHLSLVLKNLTLFFAGVGYTQGMNFVIGFLLLCGFGPKQAYWMFIHLSFNKNFLFIRNFHEGFKNPMFIIKVFEEFMSHNQKLDALRKNLETMGINGFIYSFSWFLCYFLYSLKPKCCVLLWDFFLIYNSNKRIKSKDKEPLKETKKAIIQKTQFQLQEQRIQKRDPQYYRNILSQRGSITNLIYLGCQMMQYLQQSVNECETPEQMMKIFRNESLMERIQPQTIIKMIENIKKKNSQLFGSSYQISWRSLVQRMNQQDKQLFQIYTIESKYKVFMEECLGLRRPSQKQISQSIKVKIQPKVEG